MRVLHHIARTAGDRDAHRLHGRLGRAGGSANDPTADGQLFADVQFELAGAHARVAELGGRLDVAAQHPHLAGIEAEQVVGGLHIAADVHLVGIQIGRVQEL